MTHIAVTVWGWGCCFHWTFSLTVSYYCHFRATWDCYCDKGVNKLIWLDSTCFTFFKNTLFGSGKCCNLMSKQGDPSYRGTASFVVHNTFTVALCTVAVIYDILLGCKGERLGVGNWTRPLQYFRFMRCVIACWGTIMPHNSIFPSQWPTEQIWSNNFWIQI